MNEVTLPPSPNWYLSNILACASDGTIAWGFKNSIIIAKTKENLKKLDYSIIEKAHSDRVTSVVFSPRNEDNDHFLVSGGDDNIVKIWNLKDLNVKLKNSCLDKGRKVTGIDWSTHNSNLICFITETGLVVSWNIDYDTTQIITLGKVTATCLACCPHDSNIVSVGSKSGLIYIVDISGSGNIKYKLRGHDVEVVSLSWCPVPVNIFDETNPKELLLASGAKDRVIFLWKAGSDGRYQSQITFPSSPSDSSNYKNKINVSTCNYTAVNWLTSTILFTSSPWGELLMWNLTGNEKKKFNPKLIHAKHGKGLFSIAGLVEKSNDECENNKNENWRAKMNVKAIWTVAQDRQIVCCSILNNEPVIEYTIPTQGGFVYCMSACSIDTSQIAIGVGDAMIRLWNLSEPHENIMELQMFWEKIKGQVRSLSWHPEKENILAFATNEGRVGTFDINTKKPPIIYRPYHRHIIYRISWGPAANVNNYALYTCGDGELVYYNPEKFNDVPIPVIKKKECTEFCWKTDYSLLALGFIDGSVSFLNRDLTEYGNTIHLLNKAVQCLAWHPESTSSDLDFSNMQNYLAVAINGPEIVVFEVNTSKNLKECTSDESSFYKVVATLNAHSEKVVCLAWSPHISGYLVSGSYDYTAQVWKVETQEVIASYTSHSAPIQCCMWSPFSQDLIITGSFDFTLRIWSISNQKISTAPTAIRTSAKHRQRTKKKKTLINNSTSNEIETKSENTVDQSKILVNDEKTINQVKNSEDQNTNKNNYKVMKKKKSKKTTRFPGYAELANNNKLWCSSIKNLLNTVKNNNFKSELATFNSNEIESISNERDETLKLNESIHVLLGSKKDLEDTLNNEKKLLNSNEQYNIVTEIDLWSENLNENLYEAMRKKRLNDFLVSLAPRDSIKTWEKMCEAYASQLIFEENPYKAVSYLLCINKVNAAIDVFMTEKLYKEAYALASSRLDSEDPIIKNILSEWAHNAQSDGHFQNAVECYIKLGNFAKAAKILERRKDFHSLILAIDLAEAAQDLSLSEALADKAILEALCNYKIEAAKSIIEKHPQIRHREVEVEIFSKLNKILEDVNDETIFNWLKGLSDVSLLQNLSNSFTTCPEKYLLLLQKDVFPHLSNELMIQINVSHQLALSLLSNQENQKLQHIVKALDIISQYEKINFSTCGDKFPLLIKYLFMLDNKTLTDSDSIFNSNENGIVESLRAYLCHAVINWFHECKLNQHQISECMDLILIILEKCINDLLNKESVKFWTTSNEIMKLETQLSSTIGNLKIREDNVDETKTIIERLEQLKHVKNVFLNHRISSPNPLFSYGAVMEFITKISNEKVREKINELVMNTWKEAIS